MKLVLKGNIPIRTDVIALNNSNGDLFASNLNMTKVQQYSVPYNTENAGSANTVEREIPLRIEC